LGRLLITLYLVSNNILRKPALYLSDFFEKNKGYYYDNLMLARQTGNITQWVKFFLVGVCQTSKRSIAVFQAIIELNAKIEQQLLPQLGSKIENGRKLIRKLYQEPILDATSIAAYLEISSSTANRLIQQFVDMGILHELTGYRRNRKFLFKEYFDLFQ